MTPESQPTKQTATRSATWLNRIEQWADDTPPNRFFLAIWMHSLVRIILITLKETERNRLSLRSSALTYALLLSMVPMLAMSTALVKGLGGGDQLREMAYRYIDTLEETGPMLPLGKGSVEEGAQEHGDDSAASGPKKSKQLTDHLRSAADKVFNYVDRTNFATLGSFGMLGIFLSVILLLGQIETAMNNIWHVQDGRSILRKLTDYLTLMVLLPIALNVALAAGAVLGSESLTGQIDRFIPGAWIKMFLLNGIPILVLSVTLFVIYVFFPNTKPKAIPTMIGAVLAGFMWFVTQNVYISLQVGVAKYNAIYGSFATIPLFLAWMYLGWLFILIGAQVAFAIQNNRSYQLVKQPQVPALQLSSALDLCSYVTSRFTQQQETKLEDVLAAYPAYEPALLENSRDLLVAGGILHHAEETGCLMPSLPPESISNAQVIETVLGTGPASTEGGEKTARVVEAAIEALPEPIEESVKTGKEESDNPEDNSTAQKD